MEVPLVDAGSDAGVALQIGRLAIIGGRDPHVAD